VAENTNLVGGFELKNCIASGSSTQIWEVVEQGATVPFAMKLLLPESLKDAEAKAVLKHEYKVGQGLEHPGFVRFHRIELTRDHGFFIMDYFRAPSLKAQISANLPETQARMKKIVEAICQAYVYLHDKGWLHRDIKPDNILVNKTGEVRVIDFSLACRNATGVMKLLAGKQKSIMGTRTYIAPEIILRNPPTPQSDIYSLAVTLYEIATGAPPFAGLSPNDLLKKHLSENPAPPTAINRNISPELEMMLLRMLAKKPKDRPKEMREVMSLFRNCKFFIEDPIELHERKVREAKANESLSVDKRLDSRADADRVSRGISAPVKAKKAGRTTAPIGELEAPKKQGAPTAQPAQPAAQQFPQMPFGMPGMMPPMMPPMMPGVMPGMMPQPMMQPPMMPGMMPQPMMQPPMMPGMMPPQMMPGMMPQPMMHPGMMPAAPQMTPGTPAQSMPNPVAPPAPTPTAATPPATVAPQPAVPSAQPSPAAPASEGQKTILLPLERRAAAAAKPAEEHTDLEFMTELPDIA
jgi:serine/threonine-protein kinase